MSASDHAAKTHASVSTTDSGRRWRSPDLRGQTFGQLTVVDRLPSKKVGTQGKSLSAVWRCLCVCGEERAVTTTYLRNGTTARCKSCADTSRRDSLRRWAANETPEQKASRAAKAIRTSRERGVYSDREKRVAAARKGAATVAARSDEWKAENSRRISQAQRDRFARMTPEERKRAVRASLGTPEEMSRRAKERIASGRGMGDPAVRAKAAATRKAKALDRLRSNGPKWHENICRTRKNGKVIRQDPFLICSIPKGLWETLPDPECPCAPGVKVRGLRWSVDPRDGYKGMTHAIQLSVLRLEEKLTAQGRKKPLDGRYEQAHHLDGNTLNNDASNLELKVKRRHGAGSPVHELHRVIDERNDRIAELERTIARMEEA